MKCRAGEAAELEQYSPVVPDASSRGMRKYGEITLIDTRNLNNFVVNLNINVTLIFKIDSVMICTNI